MKNAGVVLVVPRDRRDIAAVYKCSHHSTTPEAGREFSTPRSSHMRKPVDGALYGEVQVADAEAVLKGSFDKFAEALCLERQITLSILTDFAELAVSD